MEDLSRFSGPVRKSSRLASYYATSTGAAAGLAKALARASGAQVPLAARTVPTARTVAPAKPKTHQADVSNRAAIIQSANASETMRWAKVLGHEVSRGRERLAAHLLSQPQRFSAAQIIAAMSSEASGGAKSQQNAANWGKAASWDEVRADVLARTGRA